MNDVEQAIAEAEAAALRRDGYTFRQIAEAQGCALSTAHERVQKAIAAVPVEAVNAIRATELERLDAMLRIAWKQATTDQPKVDHGRVVYDDSTGEPVIDHAAKLNALDRLLRISAERRRLIPNLEAPRTASVTVYSEDTIDAMIREAEAALAEPDRDRRPAGEAPTAEGATAAGS